MNFMKVMRTLLCKAIEDIDTGNSNLSESEAEEVIENAIVFWFKDEDAEDGKLWDYFDE